MELSKVTPRGPQSGLPLVSVIILNYKRLEALARTIDSVLGQDYPLREIIVVDNHSEEDVRNVVGAKDPEIKLIELTENLGSCAGRNAGIRESRGEILVTLDNDVILFSPSELTHIVKAFEERPDVHVLVFQICDAETGDMRQWEWCHPKYWREFSQSEFETYFLPEGASAFRRQALEVAGLYYEPFFIYHEGGDLALRLIDRGFRILYCPRIRVGHLQLAEARSPGRSYYFHTRNWIWIAYKDFPLYQGIQFLVPKMGMMLYFTIRSGAYRHFLRGLWDGLKGLKRIRLDRTPVGKQTVKYVAALDKGRPGWRVRLARHRVQPQV
jgi:GT2 family glycosyltransferase